MSFKKPRMRELLVQVLGIAQTTPSTLLPCEAVSSPFNGNIPVDVDNWRFPGRVRVHDLDTYTSLNTTERIQDLYRKTKIKLNRKRTVGVRATYFLVLKVKKPRP